MDPPIRILIVDDSPEDREIFRRHLLRVDGGRYRLFEASSGGEGLQIARTEPLDCILLDYSLPDTDGLEFLAQLAGENDADVPAVLMLTGHGNETIAVEAMKRGAGDYLVKGIDGSALRAAIDAAIERARLKQRIREQQVQIEDAARRKNEFLAMLAHELRNPMAPILNGIQLARMSGVDEPLREEALGIVERSVRQMSRLVDDLLDATRVNRGTISLRLERLDLARIVRRAAEDRRPVLDGLGLALSVETPETPIWVSGDDTRLSQIMNNLIDNAAKFTDRGGRVSVLAQLDPASATASVTVRDTGIGIDPLMLDRIFDVFTQADRSLERSRGGLGLGLSVAKQLTELHGGRLSALSAGPGTGSEFALQIPAQAEPAAISEVPADVRPSGRPLRVLVVEDHHDAAESLRLLLHLLGHEVQVAHTGPDGLGLALGWSPDVILSDIGLPGMSGLALSEEYHRRSAHNRARCIAISGYASEEDRKRSREAGFEAHLAKPIDVRELVELLRVP